MAFNFDSFLGVHEPALHLRSRRAEVIASNLANLDTPGYKARDIDFSTALQQQGAGTMTAQRMAMTSSKHIQPPELLQGYELAYRNPYQPSMDGNTVEHQVEMAAYSDNAMRYLATLRFISGKFNTLQTAIRGQ
jgi:flagellar basal-body rod protein FlgB